MSAPWMDDDALVASVDLIGRTGARDLEIGHDGDGDEPAVSDVRWHAVCSYSGTKVIEDGHPDPVTAVEALARSLMTGGVCTHCQGLIALSDRGAVIRAGSRLLDGTVMTEERARAMSQCRWTRQGARWARGCEDRFPVTPSGTVRLSRRDRRAKGARRG